MIDFGKPVQTRNGHAVKIFMTNGDGEYPVLGAYEFHPGRWQATQWHSDGIWLHGTKNELDLVQVELNSALPRGTEAAKFFLRQALAALESNAATGAGSTTRCAK